MPDGTPESQILRACAAGDIDTLKSLFTTHGITASHTRRIYGTNPWDVPIPADKSLPSVYDMIYEAVASQQSSVVTFLFNTFPGVDLGDVIGAAIDEGEDMVKLVCRLDPDAAKGIIDPDNIGHTAIAYACMQQDYSRKWAGVETAARIVSVLLANGADPNGYGERIRFPNGMVAVQGGLPAKTVEEFFDAGYRCDDCMTVSTAVERGRKAVVKVLFERGAKLPRGTARWPPLDGLVESAKKNGDYEMEKLLMDMYPWNHSRATKRVCAVM